MSEMIKPVAGGVSLAGCLFMPITALIIFAAIMPMNSMSGAESALLVLCAIAVPVLASYGPLRGVQAHREGRRMRGWLWVMAPAVPLLAIIALIISRQY